MNLLLIAVVLGLVEGLTEFLPVSSTGHLIVVADALGYTGPEAATFNIFIQLGAIAAVVVEYRSRFLGLLVPRGGPGFHGWRGLSMLALTTAPAVVLGLLSHDFIKQHLFHPDKVAIGLAVGAVWLLVTEHFFRHGDPRPLDELTPATALGIGFFQCLALWPGMSRSASTILGGMLLGLDRKAATEFSFFAAVPLLSMATLYDLYASRDVLTAQALPHFAVGFAVSWLCAWAAIRFLVRFVSRHTLRPFGWYRLALAGVILWQVGSWSH